MISAVPLGAVEMLALGGAVAGLGYWSGALMASGGS
jgi:hypothetical protein